MTRKKWAKLSLGERWVKVAELHKWRDLHFGNNYHPKWGLMPLYGCHPKRGNNFSEDVAPNFLNDLNAMHEATSSLTDVQYDNYCNILWNMCNGASGKSGAINATAAQRAEAFVLAMEPEGEQ